LSLVNSRAAVSSASNCRWVSPSVGDSGGTFGPQDVVDWRVLQDAVDHAGTVETGDY
jgi:hypothetical protein